MSALLKPDDVTAAALKRLRNDSDFQHVTDWLSRALKHQDQANRAMVDGVLLRMGQGAAMRTAEIVDAFTGAAAKGALSDTRGTGRRVQSETA